LDLAGKISRNHAENKRRNRWVEQQSRQEKHQRGDRERSGKEFQTPVAVHRSLGLSLLCKPV
jgi:hypothetical protein